MSVFLRKNTISEAYTNNNILDWNRIIDVSKTLGQAYSYSSNKYNPQSSTSSSYYCRGVKLLVNAAIYVVSNNYIPLLLAETVLLNQVGDMGSMKYVAIVTPVLKAQTTLHIGTRSGSNIYSGIHQTATSLFLIPTFSSAGKIQPEDMCVVLDEYVLFNTLTRTIGSLDTLKSIMAVG